MRKANEEARNKMHGVFKRLRDEREEERSRKKAEQEAEREKRRHDLDPERAKTSAADRWRARRGGQPVNPTANPAGQTPGNPVNEDPTAQMFGDLSDK